MLPCRCVPSRRPLSMASVASQIRHSPGSIVPQSRSPIATASAFAMGAPDLDPWHGYAGEDCGEAFDHEGLTAWLPGQA